MAANSADTYALLGTIFNWASIFAAFIAAVTLGLGTYYNSLASKLRPVATVEQVTKVENRVTAVSGHLKVHLHWDDDGKTPMGESEYGGELGSETAVEFQQMNVFAEPATALIILERSRPYRVVYIDKNSGQFECDLQVAPGGYPLNAQINDLLKLKFMRVLIPLKQYQVGLVNYAVQIINAEVTLNVNGITAVRTFYSPKTFPKKVYVNSGTGYVNQVAPINELVEFENPK